MVTKTNCNFVDGQGFKLCQKCKIVSKCQLEYDVACVQNLHGSISRDVEVTKGNKECLYKAVMAASVKMLSSSSSSSHRLPLNHIALKSVE